MEPSQEVISAKYIFCYGVGHVLNDVCASMWFTYLMVFFHLVLQFDSTRAGSILLIGQVADALSTPFVGYFSDSNDNTWLCRFGRRKAWHLVGTICVLCSFPFIFTPCIHCSSSSLDAQLVYYAAFVAIFQFGWASVQISHLALIPDLTPHEHQRTRLTSIRSSFTVLSNLLIYLATYVALQIGEDTDPSNQIGPGDAKNFQRVVFFGLGFGAITSLVFHIGVKEESGAHTRRQRMTKQKTLKDFLKDPQLYQVALVYTCSRLFVNLSQVYIPLYLHDTLGRSAATLAAVPLVTYLSSLLATTVVHTLNQVLGRVLSYVFGAAVGVAGCLWVLFGSGIYFNEYEIYIVGALFGFGGSMMLVTTLGVTADLIGLDSDAGAFVYGTMSFADKLCNGGAVMIISVLKCSSGCPGYYRDVLAYVCGGAAVLGLFPLSPLRYLSQRYTLPPAPMREPIIDDTDAADADDPGCVQHLVI